MKLTNTDRKPKKENSERRKLLTYERRGRKPIYYRNYKRVLNGELPPEAVMGSGVLQGILVQLIVAYLWKQLGKDYFIETNKVGFKLPHGGWYDLDIALWRKEGIKKPLPRGYIDIPPKVVIEVDTKVDLENFEKRFGLSYINAKTEDFLKAGVEKVIWAQTAPKKVLVAERGKQPWFVANWNYPVEVIEGVEANLDGLVGQNL